MAALSGARRRSGLGGLALRWAVLLAVGAYMLLPLLAMLEFSTRGIGGARSLDGLARDRGQPGPARGDLGLARARRAHGRA